MRPIYDHHDSDLALEFVEQLGLDLQNESCPIEANQLGPTTLRWKHQIASWHATHVSNGPTESANNLIKRVKRVPRDAQPRTIFAACGSPSRAQYREGVAAGVGRRFRDDTCSSSMPAPATSSRHLHTGHHQGSMQATPLP